MPGEDLGNATASFGRPQGENRRTKSMATAVSDDERQRYVGALKQAGFPDKSAGIRTLLEAFADSARVRDAVFAWAETNRSAA